MRINLLRDTFFNLINFKTASKTQKSEIREYLKTNQTKTKQKKRPKSNAHPKLNQNQKSNVFTAVYLNPDNSTPQKIKPSSKTHQIKNTRVYKIAWKHLQFKNVNDW